ncbi:MAG: outer membrane lipoprotein-sorting protein [Crocinitomicaceae bacterium]|nr:outer membrane lipoprotein-sorting protein [Crocinitomicaceae bacterium]|tara:strand:- start:699 stop:1439 length:741 start_codon:yes stop_codon:yes gene_type:complete
MKILLSTTFLFFYLFTNSQTAYEIIEKADSKMRGKSSYSEMSITIVRPKWQKVMTMKNWSMGNDYAVSLVTNPAKEKGSVFLKRGNEVWNYLPSLERTIKLPPSMMNQSFMGTDLTNDDLVKQSSMVVDYSHKIIGEEQVRELKCWKLELSPKQEATVVWGKLVVWIDQKDFMQLKVEFYDEDLEIVNLMEGYNVQLFGNKKLPSKIEFIPLDDEGNKTIIEYKNWNFDVEIPSNYFTTQYVSRLK